MTSSEEIIEQLQALATDRPPVCFGTCPIAEKDFALYYGKGNDARQISLHTASDAELEHLATSTDKATFGMNNLDVLDESYRKAGKMELDAFSVKLDVERAGILDRVKNDLLDRKGFRKGVHCEMYKLNVYGQGCFFKAHKDTPRSDTMFGSLVIVFPTPHVGGALLLRHGGKEWTFDAAAQLAATPAPSVGYIASTATWSTR
ncbi:uncharacterized protein LOC129584136 [Paramacrobiotus metropolitanus]|uniref:uncharacterized protein LOC129584136 n=1 Tax=Paramacrobiotus metropolitanus TaxID=2943436 RepID=UPI0024460B27|nr:uncharacterized protein LOC129584136 [Paramacrobiotus metropolitanus]